MTNTSDGNNKRKFSWALMASVVFHGVLLFYLGKYALDKTLPEGDVISLEMNFDPVKGEQLKTTEVSVVEQREKPAAAPIQPATSKSLMKELPKKNIPTDTGTQSNEAPPVAVVESNTALETNTQDSNSEQENDVVTNKNEGELQTPPMLPPTEPAANVQPQDTTTTSPETLPNNEVVNATEETTNQNYGAPTGTVLPDNVLTPMPGNKKPDYPYWSRLRGQQGTVVVHYKVSDAGTVEEVKLVKSSGFPFLDSSATKAVSNWKFQPMGKTGWYERPFTFQFKGDAQAVPSTLRTN